VVEALLASEADILDMVDPRTIMNKMHLNLDSLAQVIWVSIAELHILLQEPMVCITIRALSKVIYSWVYRRLSNLLEGLKASTQAMQL